MMTYKAFLKTLMVAGFALSLSACDQGPAEDAGEELDDVVTDTGNAVEDACEDAKEGMDTKDQDC
ncbi:hypothetical protein CA267_016880 [Alteromonas pelagimontana]|uniref:YtxH domain-containing protein n=1 Tax=Alteromonas pelagimontana TaxID=1858656 RepID=A0A6M4MGV0_9ALTE|nr:hypothetical protein [Alteromonas pelagimontana]QJR82303.1 hypothetical protein CA267_016880 [Alteromonas pelagimontana]